MASTAAKKAKSKSDSSAEVFEAIKNLLKPYERQFAVLHDKKGVYYLETKTAVFRGKPMFAAGVRTGKAYVSLYFMPIYCEPELKKDLPPELRKRMQGKACFNFKSVDVELFAEVAKLLKRGLPAFAKVKDFEAKMQGRTYS